MISEKQREHLIHESLGAYPKARRDTVWHFLNSVPLSAPMVQNKMEVDYGASVHNWSHHTVAAMKLGLNKMYKLMEEQECQKKPIAASS